MQEKTKKRSQKLASKVPYVSPSQLSIEGFDTTFEQKLNPENRWVLLSKLIPWDELVSAYNCNFKSTEGRPAINGRIILGAMFIKHMNNLTDRDTIDNICENVYMQYFLGYSSFSDKPPFTAPLFVTIRERLNQSVWDKINDVLARHYFKKEEEAVAPKEEDKGDADNKLTATTIDIEVKEATDSKIEFQTVSDEVEVPNNGKLIMDATVAPQGITFPTDLKLLNAAREKSEQLIDKLYNKQQHKGAKPRTYRENARKDFLNSAKKKFKTFKQIYRANGQQIRYLKRNLQHIGQLLLTYEKMPLTHSELKYLQVLHIVYEQQNLMHTTKTKTVADRIVNIHQPHVRPMVRGKEGKKVEFGSKLQVSLLDGFTFLDKLDWNAFNEGQCLQESVLFYKNRFGHYPKEVLADQIYATKENRAWLKDKGIKLSAKPLGRPSKTAVANHIRPGDRNPIEGKFGQAKLAYGLDRIRAKKQDTSESWIACIAIVLNLVSLTRRALVSLYEYLLIRIAPQNRPLAGFEFFSKPYIVHQNKIYKWLNAE